MIYDKSLYKVLFKGLLILMYMVLFLIFSYHNIEVMYAVFLSFSITFLFSVFFKTEDNNADIRSALIFILVMGLLSVVFIWICGGYISEYHKIHKPQGLKVTRDAEIEYSRFSYTPPELHNFIYFPFLVSRKMSLIYKLNVLFIYFTSVIFIYRKVRNAEKKKT